jgi:hypothetical protein
MAELNFDVVETHGRKRRLVMGSFVPNDTSTIDNTKNQGNGFTVAYAATGQYNLTFSAKYGVLLDITATLVQATRSQVVEVKAVDANAGTATIEGFAVGSTTPAPITAASGTYVTFTASFGDALQL